MDYDFVAFIVDKLPPLWAGKAEAYMGIGYFVVVNKMDQHMLGPLWTLCGEMSHEFLHMLLMHLGFTKEIWHDLVHTNDTAPRNVDFWYKQRRTYWLRHPYMYFMKFMVTSSKWISQDTRTSKTTLSTVGGDYL
ncbi:hypothetical protein LCGC14_3102140 [marine sediment metagenome]|uniref:Uncharacterized protein n=1 Tax=marine sediment metagenome TaxID=412755 RepID=A0A0F8YXH6_9ZZZZ